MLKAALNISWKQHSTRKELYGIIPLIIPLMAIVLEATRNWQET